MPNHVSLHLDGNLIGAASARSANPCGRYELTPILRLADEKTPGYRE